jgi:UDP-N-acetylglucosamine enolpyruvyl transferase
LAAEGETKISDAQMLEKSFGTYVPEMQKAGANFELVEEA